MINDLLKMRWNQCENPQTFGCVENRRQWQLTGSSLKITHLSCETHNGYETAIVIAMISGSGYTTRLLLKLTGV